MVDLKSSVKNKKHMAMDSSGGGFNWIDFLLLFVLIVLVFATGNYIGHVETKKHIEKTILETNLKNGSVIRTNDIYGREFYLNSK